MSPVREKFVKIVESLPYDIDEEILKRDVKSILQEITQKYVETYGTDDLSENDKDSNIFEDVIKQAVKHPLITIAAITAAIFAGKQIYNSLSSSPVKTVQEKPIMPEIVQEVKPQKTVAEQIAEFNKTIEEGIKYEKEIGYKNLEIFKGLSDKEREAIVRYYDIAGKNRAIHMNIYSATLPFLKICRL